MCNLCCFVLLHLFCQFQQLQSDSVARLFNPRTLIGTPVIVAMKPSKQKAAKKSQNLFIIIVYSSAGTTVVICSFTMVVIFSNKGYMLVRIRTHYYG